MNRPANEFEQIIIEEAFKIADDRKRYEYIYISLCDYMDKIFSENNICDFKEDKCIRQREGKAPHETMGCCYTFEYSKFTRFPKDTGLCKYINENKCSVKNLTCKMFTCKYLKEKGYNYLIRKNPVIKLCFNKKQVKYLEEAFFKSMEEVINRLLELS